jgi:hypothetical protein
MFADGAREGAKASELEDARGKTLLRGDEQAGDRDRTPSSPNTRRRRKAAVLAGICF